MKKWFIWTLMACLAASVHAADKVKDQAKPSGLAAMDADKDGKVTQAEFIAAASAKCTSEASKAAAETNAKKSFVLKDKNHDGVLSGVEMGGKAPEKKAKEKKKAKPSSDEGDGGGGDG